jgi:hypothetical protein
LPQLSWNLESKQTQLSNVATMAPAAEGHLAQPIVTQSKLLSLPSEIKMQIYKEVFRGLQVQLFQHSSAASLVSSTLVNTCQVCHTFRVEARPIFLRTVTVVLLAEVPPQNKIRRLSKEDCLSIRNLVILVTRQHSHDYSRIIEFLPNIEQLTIDLTPWCPGYLDIERAIKSKDTVVITHSDAEYDEDTRIGVNRLFATFEDWVKLFAIDRASVNSTSEFKLLVRLDFLNEPDDDAPTTIVVGCTA